MVHIVYKYSLDRTQKTVQLKYDGNEICAYFTNKCSTEMFSEWISGGSNLPQDFTIIVIPRVFE